MWRSELPASIRNRKNRTGSGKSFFNRCLPWKWDDYQRELRRRGFQSGGAFLVLFFTCPGTTHDTLWSAKHHTNQELFHDDRRGKSKNIISIHGETKPPKEKKGAVSRLDMILSVKFKFLSGFFTCRVLSGRVHYSELVYWYMVKFDVGKWRTLWHRNMQDQVVN